MTPEQRKTVEALTDALAALRQVCAETQSLQGREFVSLGIQVNNALIAGRSLLAAEDAKPVEPVALSDEQIESGMRQHGITVWGPYAEAFWAGARFAESAIDAARSADKGKPDAL